MPNVSYTNSVRIQITFEIFRFDGLKFKAVAGSSKYSHKAAGRLGNYIGQAFITGSINCGIKDGKLIPGYKTCGIKTELMKPNKSSE